MLKLAQPSIRVNLSFYTLWWEQKNHRKETPMGKPGNQFSPRLAWFFAIFFILVVGTQIFLGLEYNSTTPPELTVFNGLMTLITLTLALFQIFPGGMTSFFLSLFPPDLRKFLRQRLLSVLFRSILITSLLFNIYLVIPKPQTETNNKATPTSSGISTITPKATSSPTSSTTGSLREFQIPTPDSRPVAIIKRSDGNFWFTEEHGNKIGRITPQGTIDEFVIPTPNCIPGGLTLGPDGNLWFYENKGDKIGRITPQGQITEFPVPSGSDLVGITTGPDGNIWFVGFKTNKIWKMNTSGVITGAFPIPTNGSGTETIIAGPDGNVWFVEDWGNKIGRVTPQGNITEYQIPTPLIPNQQNYHDMSVGPDGNLWFTEGLADKIGRITPQGDIAEFSVPPPGASPSSPCACPDGNIWFTDDANHIRRLTTSGTFISDFMISTPASRAVALTVGPNNTVWFIEPLGNIIGQIITNL